MTAENLVKLLQMTQLHDLLCLFNLLRAPTCERLEAMWRDYVQSQPAETTEPFKQFGMRIEPELTAALAAGRRAFERLRYWHEEHEFVFYLGALPTMLFTVAFKIRPDWAEPCQAGRATCAWVASIGNKRATAISETFRTKLTQHCLSKTATWLARAVLKHRETRTQWQHC